MKTAVDAGITQTGLKKEEKRRRERDSEQPKKINKMMEADTGRCQCFESKQVADVRATWAGLMQVQS